MAKRRTPRGAAPDPPALADVIERNIETMLDFRDADEQRRSPQDRIADALTRFSGSMWFAYLHVFWFASWIGVNEGWLGRQAFDPFPFGLLTMIVSLEAIFLSTFVLISQNRAAALADIRSELDLQIDLMSEHEVTQLLRMTQAIGAKLGVDECQSTELTQLREEVPLLGVIRELQRRAAGEPARGGATSGTGG